MDHMEEKRNSRRSELKRPVVFVLDDSDTFYNADLLNYSDSGARLHSDHPIYPGARIYIMTENEPIDDSAVEFPESCFAEVVWCKPSKNSYMTGIRIVESKF